jgi:hypothetical protein
MKQLRARCLVGLAALVLAGAAFPVHGTSIELGVSGGGGLALMYGSFLDSRTESLAEIGAASPSAPGSSQAGLFPGWTAGVYGQVDVLKWLAIRFEALYESAGAERVAMTSAGAPFDQWGVYFASVSIPVRGVAHFALGPGEFQGTLGPFLGIVAGPITVVDRYTSAETAAVITPDFAHAFFFGLVGGIGYSMRLGPGRAGLEIRSDWSILPVTVGGAQGIVNPIGLELVGSYGIQIGGSAR